VDETGEPLEPLVLQAQPFDVPHARPAWVWTRPDGGFVFKGVPPGRIQLGATIQGDYRILGTFAAPAEDVEVVVER
jgi:hypothetical protein